MQQPDGGLLSSALAEGVPLGGMMAEASSQGTRFRFGRIMFRLVPPHPSEPIMWWPSRRPRREARASRDGMHSLSERNISDEGG